MPGHERLSPDEARRSLPDWLSRSRRAEVLLRTIPRRAGPSPFPQSSFLIVLLVGRAHASLSNVSQP
jgi:hypothetical protein